MKIQPLRTLSDKQDYLAFFKYSGKLVEDGYLDARKAAEALQGIDQVMRYFLIKTNPELSHIDFELPIKVRQGSWEALIPHGLGEWLLTTVATGVALYGKKALETIAENDFKDVRTIDIVKTAIKSIKWVLRISKHMGSMAIRKFHDVTFDGQEINEQQLIGLENSKGDVLYVPQEYLEIYRNCPEKLFDKLINNVAADREFELGFNPKEPLDQDDTLSIVTINISEKYIFTSSNDEETVVLPELVHGEYVELEGHVTRGNENSNTIGFQFNGHVITCSPSSGNIKDNKMLLFTSCVIKGVVDRSGQYNLGNEKRPHIKYDSLIGLASNGTQFKLL